MTHNHIGLVGDPAKTNGLATNAQALESDVGQQHKLTRGKYREGYKNPNAPKKLFVVLRGLPGCGADLRARELMAEGVERGLRSMAVISTEDLFYNERGEYVFDKNKVGPYHRLSYGLATTYFVSNMDMVILNNYNIKKSHYRHYTTTALSFSYDVVEQIVGDIRLTPERLKEYVDNCGGRVPDHVILKYSREFEP